MTETHIYGFCSDTVRFSPHSVQIHSVKCKDHNTDKTFTRNPIHYHIDTHVKMILEKGLKIPLNQYIFKNCFTPLKNKIQNSKALIQLVCTKYACVKHLPKVNSYLLILLVWAVGSEK